EFRVIVNTSQGFGNTSEGKQVFVIAIFHRGIRKRKSALKQSARAPHIMENKLCSLYTPAPFLGEPIIHRTSSPASFHRLCHVRVCCYWSNPHSWQNGICSGRQFCFFLRLKLLQRCPVAQVPFQQN